MFVSRQSTANSRVGCDMALRAYSFRSTRERLRAFQQAMLNVDESPWQLMWEGVCECLEVCESEVAARGEVERERDLARFQRLLRKCVLEDIDSLPEEVDVRTGPTHWPELYLQDFIARMGGQASEAMYAAREVLERMAKEVVNLPEASWLQTAREALTRTAQAMEEVAQEEYGTWDEVGGGGTE